MLLLSEVSPSFIVATTNILISDQILPQISARLATYISQDRPMNFNLLCYSNFYLLNNSFRYIRFFLIFLARFSATILGSLVPTLL